MSKDAALKILSSRSTVTAAMAGQLIRTTIVGMGTTLPLTDKEGNQVRDDQGQPLYKHIYNVKLNSQIAQVNERNREILKKAIAGDEEAMNDYLNKTQVSFNEVLRTGKAPSFGQGQVVDGIVDIVTTENGSLITLKNVTTPVAKTLNAKAVASLEDLLGGSEEQSTGSESEQPEIMAQS